MHGMRYVSYLMSLLLLLALSGCFRERQLLSGLIIAPDGSILQATPEGVRDHHVAGLQGHLQQVISADLVLQISLDPLPQPDVRQHWGWQELHAEIQVQEGDTSKRQVRRAAQAYLGPLMHPPRQLEITITFAQEQE